MTDPSKPSTPVEQMTNLVTPMAKWKQRQPLEFVTAATQRFSFRNWQSGNDDSVYYK